MRERKEERVTQNEPHPPGCEATNGWQACVHESHWVMVRHIPLSVTCGLVGLIWVESG